METHEIIQAPEPYQPTSEQLSREESLRRFNRRFIYWPIGIATLLSFSIVLTMVLYIILTPSTEYLVTFSAIADAVIILMASTLIVLFSLFLALSGAIYYQSRKQGIAPIRQTQYLFWRLESFLIQIYQAVASFAPKVASPFIAVGARIAYLRVLLLKFWRLFSRG
jgi:hypothetical protein